MTEPPKLRRTHDYSKQVEAIESEARVDEAKRKIVKAVEGLPPEDARKVVLGAKRMADAQLAADKALTPLDIISTGREMLTAVESPSLAYVRAEDPALLRTLIGRSGESSELGPLAGQRRAVKVKVATDVQLWFDEAVDSMQEATDGKISCPLMKVDIEALWGKVYAGESGFKSAKEAAQKHIDEMVEYLQGSGRGSSILREAVRKAEGEARLRLQAILTDDDREDDERRRRALVMLIATEMNMECTAVSWAEYSTARGSHRYEAIAQHGEAHGFGPRAVIAPDSSTWRRYEGLIENNATLAQYSYCLWRMACEACAYPNVSDTFTEMEQASIEAAKRMLNPPDGSPANVEVRLMQVAYWAAMLCAAANKMSRSLYNDGWLLDAYTWLGRFGETHCPRIVFDAVERIRPTTDPDWNAEPKAWEARLTEFRGLVRYWSCTWRESGYARIDVGHKLAAALMLTDVKEDIEVRAPWRAFSLHVPPGITRVSRILVMSADRDDQDTAIAILGVIFEDGSFGEFSVNHLEQTEVDLLTNLVRGVCLAAEQGHAERAGSHGATGSKSSSKRVIGKPPAGERYQLAAPVKIDLRDVVREHLGGKRKGGSPKVQFIVRGHWRNQVHGPGRAGRKRIWIEPFWKGDEGARVLLREHKVEGDKLKEQP